MPFEDFDTYTEVDPNSHISPNGTKVDWIGITRNEDAYCYDDKGINHFDGDFEHLVEMYCDSASDAGVQVNHWAITNEVDDEWGLILANKSLLSVALNSGASDWGLYIRESDSGTLYQDSKLNLAFDTLFYLKIKRVESIGTYGTIYCYIYSDASRTVLVDTLSIALNSSKKDYRYYWCVQSFNSGHVHTATGYTQNHDLQEVLAGAVIQRRRMEGY